MLILAVNNRHNSKLASKVFQTLEKMFILAFEDKPLYSNGFLLHIDVISMGLSILYFKRSQVEFVLNYVILSLKVVLILAYSADPDEMQKYTFRSFQ